MVNGDIEAFESIKEIIPKPEVPYQKRPRYVSKYITKIRREAKEGKCPHRTFGVPEIPLKPPSEFLKKKSRVEQRRTDVKHTHFKRPNYQRKLPSWEPIKKQIPPQIPDLPKDPISVSRVNFRKQNKLDVKKLCPPDPKKRYIDTRFGDTHDLLKSGLHPIYIHRKNFGKVPKIILSDRKRSAELRKIAAEEDYERENEYKTGDGCVCIGDRHKTKQPLYHYITEEERGKLLDGMKKKWDDMMNQFQRLPFVCDTPPKALRKTKMEHELQALEKDIEIIERHPHIYVYNDND